LDWLRDGRPPPLLVIADVATRHAVMNEAKFYGLQKLESALITMMAAEEKDANDTKASEQQLIDNFDAASTIFIAAFENGTAADDFLNRCMISLRNRGSWKVEGWADFIGYDKRSTLDGVLDALRCLLQHRYQMRVKINCQIPFNRYEFPDIQLRWMLNQQSDDVTVVHLPSPPPPPTPSLSSSSTTTTTTTAPSSHSFAPVKR
jgi:hypothetical protein